METTRPNLLEAPVSASVADVMNHALSHLLLKKEAFPVYPDAEKSTHPMWKDYGLYSKFRHAEQPPTVVKVFTIAEVSWSEFTDTYSPNEENYGFVGEVELSDGWTGRFSINCDLGETVQYLQNFEKTQEAN